jgi:hypothetical protein
LRLLFYFLVLIVSFTRLVITSYQAIDYVVTRRKQTLFEPVCILSITYHMFFILLFLYSYWGWIIFWECIVNICLFICFRTMQNHCVRASLTIWLFILSMRRYHMKQKKSLESMYVFFTWILFFSKYVYLVWSVDQYSFFLGMNFMGQGIPFDYKICIFLTIMPFL